MALDLAVAVASGAPCLRRFSPAQTGRVLLFAAEDALPLVRRRLEGIAAAAAVAFDALDIHVITTPSLRLDLAEDQPAPARDGRDPPTHAARPRPLGATAPDR